MNNRKTRGFLISGCVQGVFYRASTEIKARSLGISGWVRNLADGRVEVVATGEDASLDEIEKWLWEGPEKARVKMVEVYTEPLTQFDGFHTRY